jgi:hypothetical protein
VLAAPPALWRLNFLSRVLVCGAVIGIGLGGLAWLDSGALPAAAAVFVVAGGVSAVMIARSMARGWPEAAALDPLDRVHIVRAVRRGEPLADTRLVEGGRTYARGLRAAAAGRPLWRWLLAVVLVVALATAIWDTLYGSTGSAVASALYLAALPIEFFWWPRYVAALLGRADRSAGPAPLS